MKIYLARLKSHAPVLYQQRDFDICAFFFMTADNEDRREVMGQERGVNMQQRSKPRTKHVHGEHGEHPEGRF